jgi:hypothetical protein
LRREEIFSHDRVRHSARNDAIGNRITSGTDVIEKPLTSHVFAMASGGGYELCIQHQ